MRDKNRIQPLMEKLKQCWEITPELTIYELLYNLYHDIPDKWVLYYQEDDFWMKNMENYKLTHLSNNVNIELDNIQKDILNAIKIVWEQRYDLRFPQICNLIFSIIEGNVKNLYALDYIQERLVKKDGE